ncbi:MAG: twin-arginine translocase TatA/TatE family subunit [Pseudomonadota bacterium]
MLNIGFGEILLIAALLLVVVGPERLPKMLRIAGQYYGKLRRAAQELQMAFMDEGDLLDGRHRSRYASPDMPLKAKSRGVEVPTEPAPVLPPPVAEPPVAAESASPAEPPADGEVQP